MVSMTVPRATMGSDFPLELDINRNVLKRIRIQQFTNPPLGLRDELV